MATIEELLRKIDDFQLRGVTNCIPLSLSEQRDIAFELLSQYFDLHRHDTRAKELQSQTERLLNWTVTSVPVH